MNDEDYVEVGEPWGGVQKTCVGEVSGMLGNLREVSEKPSVLGRCPGGWGMPGGMLVDEGCPNFSKCARTRPYLLLIDFVEYFKKNLDSRNFFLILVGLRDFYSFSGPSGSSSMETSKSKMKELPSSKKGLLDEASLLIVLERNLN